MASKPGAREVFVAPPGHCIVSVDYDACELRTWAQCCLWFLGYSNLAGILNDPDRCPHIELGTRLWDAGAHFNAEGQDWRSQYGWGYSVKKTDKNLIKKVRGLAKGPNFGLPGGMGAERLVDYCHGNYGVDLTLEQAEDICRVWREIYPEAQPYLDHVAKLVGRKRGSRGKVKMFVSDRWRGDVGFTDGSNGFFQALAADLAKTAYSRVVRACYLARPGQLLHGVRPLAFVHDEGLFAVPVRSLEQMHADAYEIARIMVSEGQAFLPDVLLSAAPAAMFRWSKAGGDPYKNKDGLIIPFECIAGYDGPPPPTWNLDLQARIAA